MDPGLLKLPHAGRRFFPLRLRPLLRRLFGAREIECAVDQRDVGEGLRKVADQAAGARIVFLAEQPDIVAQRQQPLEQRRASAQRFCRM